MKKLFAALVFLVLTIPAVSSAGIIGRPLNNLGLIGYWSMNEGAGIQVGDVSGNGRSGTLLNSGGNLPSWTSGKYGRGLLFDSATNYVSMGDIASMDGLSAVTVAVWAKSTASGANAMGEAHMVDKSNCTGLGGDGPFELGQYPGTNNAFFAAYQAGGANQSGTGTTNIDDGRWHLVVGRYTGTSLEIWVDGRRENAAALSGALASTNRVFSINGFCGGGGISGWLGTLDEVRVYNRALATSSIEALYTSSGAVQGSSATLSSGALRDGLVGHWTMDGSDVTDKVYDRSGQGSHGYFRGGATTSAKVLGKLGQALRFDGGNTYVDVGTLNVSGAMTLSVWAKASDLSGCSGGCELISNYNVTGDTGQFEMNINNAGDVGFSSGVSAVYAGGYTNSAPISQMNRWYHIVLTRSSTTPRTADTLRIYVDGISQSLQGGFTTAAPPTANFGRTSLARNGDYTGLYFPGALDETRIYNRELTAAEVKQLYNLGGQTIGASSNVLGTGGLNRGLVGHWTFDGADITANAIVDKSGAGNNAGFKGGATSSAKVIGKMGQAIKFNGSSSYVDMGTNASIRVNYPFTIAAWVNTPNTAIYSTLVTTASDAVTLGGANLQIDNTGKIVCGASNSLTPNQSLTNASLPVNTWKHVVCVDRGDNDQTIYIDGVVAAITADGTNGTTGTIGYPSGSARMGDDSLGNNFYPGALDDVRIYNRALSADEAKQLYNLGK